MFVASHMGHVEAAEIICRMSVEVDKSCNNGDGGTHSLIASLRTCKACTLPCGAWADIDKQRWWISTFAYGIPVRIYRAYAGVRAHASATAASFSFLPMASQFGYAELAQVYEPMLQQQQLHFRGLQQLHRHHHRLHQQQQLGLSNESCY